ncbi:MAG: fatty acid desaturase [Deinococcus sp.]|nr:fatty acid desaturase [Deinococcus sp.]
MTEELHLREYTKALKSLLPRKYFEPVASRLWYLPIFIGLTLLASWGIVHLYPWWAKLLLSLPIGYAFIGLGFFAHEVLHGAVTKNPLLRSVVGTIAFFPLCIGARLWRRWHNVEHHGSTQHPDDDPDAMSTLEAMRERPELQVFHRLIPWFRSFLLFFSFTFWFTFHGQMMLKRFLPEFKGKERAVVLFQAVLPFAFWAALAFGVGAWNFVFIFVLPWSMANIVAMSYIATNHLLNPLTATNDPLMNSLTVRSPRLVEWLHLGFGYHTEHHVFPTISPRYARKVGELLKKMWPERYNELPHWRALYYLWKTPRLYRDHRNLIELTSGRVFGTMGFGLPERVLGPSPRPFGKKKTATK